MQSKKMRVRMAFLVVVLMLSACVSDDKDVNSHENMDMNSASQESEGAHHSGSHSSSGEVPKGLKEAEDPTYKVGSQAIIKTDHMKGMNGAEAIIVGAYDTIAYAISYTPTTGGERVTNHKWVVQEEIKNVGDETLAPGTEVVVEADHMKGMDGANAEIDSAEQTTVYMVDYTPTTGGERVTNHKWVTESELSAK